MTEAGDPSLPARTGVLGGGRMGCGIAHAFLTRGAEGVVVGADPEAARAAHGKVADAVRRSADRGSLSEEVGQVLVRLTATADAGALAGCDLVVEAVPEDVELKG